MFEQERKHKSSKLLLVKIPQIKFRINTKMKNTDKPNKMTNAPPSINILLVFVCVCGGRGRGVFTPLS